MNPPIAESTLSETSIRLPEPDKENITVLTHQLPNEPILPWHHYDSPWLPDEAEAASEQVVSDDTENSEELSESPEVLSETEVSPTAVSPAVSESQLHEVASEGLPTVSEEADSAGMPHAPHGSTASSLAQSEADAAFLEHPALEEGPEL